MGRPAAHAYVLRHVDVLHVRFLHARAARLFAEGHRVHVVKPTKRSMLPVRIRWAPSTAIDARERHLGRDALMHAAGFCLCWRCTVDEKWGPKLMDRWRKLLPIVALGWRCAPQGDLEKLRAVYTLQQDEENHVVIAPTMGAGRWINVKGNRP